MRLSEMTVGQEGIVKSIEGRGNIQHRLIDMGIVRGSKVRIVKLAPLGDPMEVKVKNFDLALRLAEAAMIEVEAIV